MMEYDETVSGVPGTRIFNEVCEAPEFYANKIVSRRRTGMPGNLNSKPSGDRLFPDPEEMPGNLIEADCSAFQQDTTFLNELCKSIKSIETVSDQAAEDLIRKIFRFLLNDYQCIRAVTMRIIRLICFSETTLRTILSLKIDLFLSRALDLNAQNTDERIEALKLCAVMLQIYSQSDMKTELLTNAELFDSQRKVDVSTLFPKSVLLSIFLVAKPAFCEIEEDFSHRKLDRLALPCFAVFLEFAINEPLLVIEAAGTGWIVDALLMPNNKWVSVLVCRMLCLWLDHPRLRVEAKLNTVLEQIFAPIIEIGFFQSVTVGELKVSEERIQDILDACFEVLLNLLRSWSGLYSCASSDRYGKTVVSSPLKLLEFLGSGTVINKNLKRIRDLVVNLCCELMNCSYASKNFVSWIDAVQFYAHKDFPDPYKCSLREDFILAEHEYSLMQSEKFHGGADLLKSFRSVTLLFFVNSGILQSLVRLILVDPEDPVSLKATLLLNDFILLGSACLPLEWRLRVLSVPTLVQSVCETMTLNSAVAAIDGNYSADFDVRSDQYTFLNATSGPLLLYRLDALNNIALSARAHPTFTGNMQLFVQSARVKRCSSSSSLKIYATKREEQQDFDFLVNSLVSDSLDTNGQFCWASIDSALQRLEQEERAGLLRHKRVDRLYSFFAQIFSYFSPSSGQFIVLSDFDRLPVITFSRCLALIIPLCTIEAHFEELVVGFLEEFVNLISPDKLGIGIFSPSSLLNSNAMYYFGFIGAVSSEKYGCKLLERMNVLQTFVDIVKSSPSPEYVKLIVSSLDYSNNDEFTRLVLHTAITSASEVGRKWATRFLSVLAEKDPQSFTDWGMGFLLGQLADPSAKVVRHAIRVLTQWIPIYRECLSMLQKLRWEAFGDAGVLLRTHLFSDEKFVIENPKDVANSIDLWKEEFNTKYVDIVEDDMKVALVNVKRSLDGFFARASNERVVRCGVFLPVHLYGQLASHDSGRDWLMRTKEIDRLLTLLRDTPANMSNCEIREVKGAIFALSHFLTALDMAWADSMAAETITVICRYAEACPVLSVRGVAFWALNLIGGSDYGSRFLASLGWESSRYSGSAEKGEIEEWEIPHINPAKLWISCLDVCTSDPHYIVKKDLIQSASFSRPDRSSTIVSSNSSRPAKDGAERKDTSRSLRSYTNDSVETSGLGSTYAYESDVTSALLSEIDCGVPNIPQRHIGDESIPDTVTEGKCDFVQGVNRLHYSSVVRARLGLPTFEFGNIVAVERFLSIPICYSFMPHNELRSFRHFRGLYPSSLEAPVDEVPLRFMQAERPFVVLPCVAELTSKNIFAEEPYVSLVTDELRMQLEDTEELKKSIEEKQRHRSERCFFCLNFAQICDEKVPIISDLDFEERSAILSLIDTKFHKDLLQKAQEKRILNKYEQNPALFSCPCMYWDAFELLSDSRYRSETRRLVHDLFSDSLNVIASHLVKT